MSGVEVTIQVPAELVAALRAGAGVLRQVDVSGGASNAVARLVLDALPRPIADGDRVRTRHGYVGVVLAVDGDEAWVRFDGDDGRGTWPLEALMRDGGS